MSVAAANDQQFEFVRQLARDLTEDEIHLPSFPAVIVKIRNMLEDEECDFGKVGDVVSADAALVSRLFVFANSSYHNRSGEEVATLNDAISRLGIEVVRNTALALAIKQIVLSGKHKNIAAHLRNIWVTSMQLSSLSHAVASNTPGIRDEDAFLCGLFHEIGKVYILTKANDFPEFLGDEASLQGVLNEWHRQVGQCVVEAWGFPEEVVRSLNPEEHLEERTHLAPTLVDAIFAATLLQKSEESGWPALLEHSVFRKLGIESGQLEDLGERYRTKLESIQQALS